MKVGWAIVWAIAIILIVIGVFGIVLSKMADKQCKEECVEMDAIGHYVVHSGNFDIDDLCVCFFSDRIKSFRMGK